jgi:phosphoglycolate phosphatase-like HAD superfamily hydrolase
MLKLVVFDLDGTLLNSEEAILESLNRAFGKIGLGPYGWGPDIARFFGKPFRVWAETLLKEAGRYSEKLTDEMTNRTWDNYALLGPSLVKLNPGARATLDGLKGAGVKMAVATNMMSRHARILLPHLDIAGYFEEVCTSDSVKRAKPYNDQFECIKRRVKASASETLMVGDSATDLEFARNCGIKAALLDAPWNRALKPDYRINNLKEVLRLTRKK